MPSGDPVVPTPKRKRIAGAALATLAKRASVVYRDLRCAGALATLHRSCAECVGAASQAASSGSAGAPLGSCDGRKTLDRMFSAGVHMQIYK